jgi:hypothetical protein
LTAQVVARVVQSKVVQLLPEQLSHPRKPVIVTQFWHSVVVHADVNRQVSLVQPMQLEPCAPSQSRHVPEPPAWQFSRYCPLLHRVAAQRTQSRVEHVPEGHQTHPGPCIVSHNIHIPTFYVSHPDRIWLLWHEAASIPMQSRSVQPLGSQRVQPLPCVLAHGTQTPAFVSVQPDRYSSLAQLYPAPVLFAVVQSRVTQVLLVQAVQPAPCVTAHELHPPGPEPDPELLVHPSRYSLPPHAAAAAAQSHVAQSEADEQLTQPGRGDTQPSSTG